MGKHRSDHEWCLEFQRQLSECEMLQAINVVPVVRRSWMKRVGGQRLRYISGVFVDRTGRQERFEMQRGNLQKFLERARGTGVDGKTGKDSPMVNLWKIWTIAERDGWACVPKSRDWTGNKDAGFEWICLECSGTFTRSPNDVRNGHRSCRECSTQSPSDAVYLGLVSFLHAGREMVRLKCGKTMKGSMSARYAGRDFPSIDQWRYCVVGANRCLETERELVQICREILGEPTRGNEWFMPPTPLGREELLRRFDELTSRFSFPEQET